MKTGSIRKIKATVAAIAAMATLSACGSGDTASGGSDSEAFDPNAKTTITMGAWTLGQNPEWKAMADAFMEEYPNVTIDIKEYSADDYDKQLTGDISANSQPDVIPLKTQGTYWGYVNGGGFADISDVAKDFEGDKNIDISTLKVDGKYYALPYKNDSWLLFYNKEMFEKTGVAMPDGTWTWDDYTKAAEELKEKLPAAGYDKNQVYPTYLHNWQAAVQAFATSQTDSYTDFFKCDFDYMKPYYEQALKWQDEGLTIDYNTSFSTKVQYQAQFGTQKAAMMPMGTWYFVTFLAQQKSGDAETFDWGVAPMPQNEDWDPGTEPMTFGDPGTFAVSSLAKGQELAAAKEFVKWVAGEEGSKVLAGIGVSPAYASDEVVDVFFGADGMPQDDLSREAYQTHGRGPENPVGEFTQTIQSLLADAHSSIMSETKSIDDALADARQNCLDQGVAQE